jgi:hypothetical protein
MRAVDWDEMERQTNRTQSWIREEEDGDKLAKILANEFAIFSETYGVLDGLDPEKSEDADLLVDFFKFWAFGVSLPLRLMPSIWKAYRGELETEGE